MRSPSEEQDPWSKVRSVLASSSSRRREGFRGRVNLCPRTPKPRAATTPHRRKTTTTDTHAELPTPTTRMAKRAIPCLTTKPGPPRRPAPAVGASDRLAPSLLLAATVRSGPLAASRPPVLFCRRGPGRGGAALPRGTSAGSRRGARRGAPREVLLDALRAPSRKEREDHGPGRACSKPSKKRHRLGTARGHKWWTGRSRESSPFSTVYGLPLPPRPVPQTARGGVVCGKGGCPSVPPADWE